MKSALSELCPCSVCKMKRPTIPVNNIMVIIHDNPNIFYYTMEQFRTKIKFWRMIDKLNQSLTSVYTIEDQVEALEKGEVIMERGYQFKLER